jgi:hypothetical protein
MEFSEATGLDISIPHCVCCSLRSRQVGLDLVVVTLNESAASRHVLQFRPHPSNAQNYASDGFPESLLVFGK